MSFEIKPRVFVGSSSESKEVVEALSLLIEDSAELIPWYFEGVFKLNENVISSLVDISKSIDFAILIFSCDDKVSYRDKEYLKPRDNVVLEYGLFLGALGLKRVFFICEENVDVPTDLVGLTTLVFSDFDKGSDILDRQRVLSKTSIRLKEEFKNLGLLHPTRSIIQSYGPDIKKKGFSAQISTEQYKQFEGGYLVLVGRGEDDKLDSENIDFKNDPNVGFSKVISVFEPYPSDSISISAPVPTFDELHPFDSHLWGILVYFKKKPQIERAKTITDLLNMGGKIVDGRAVLHIPDFESPEGLCHMASYMTLEQSAELLKSLKSKHKERLEKLSDDE